jgi:hypothetical protein
MNPSPHPNPLPSDGRGRSLGKLSVESLLIDLIQRGIGERGSVPDFQWRMHKGKM